MAALRLAAEFSGYVVWFGIAAIAILLTLSFQIDRSGQ